MVPKVINERFSSFNERFKRLTKVINELSRGFNERFLEAGYGTNAEHLNRSWFYYAIKVRGGVIPAQG